MTFILHPLSHYNTITKPRAGFLIPLIEDLSIDFLSYLIFSLIDVFKDTVTRNKLIFPLAITRIFHHFSVSFPPFDHFFVMGAIDAATVRRNDAQLRSRRMQIETIALLAPTAPSTFAPSSFAGGVTLEAIMAQLVHMDSCLWHFQWWAMSSEHPYWSYHMTISCHGWFHCGFLSFSRGI